MAKYRQALPQARGSLFLTDGGIETTLIFHDGQHLPHFAAFHLMQTSEGEGLLRKYFQAYGSLARKLELGLILETATWRANIDWATKIGYSPSSLAEANRKSVDLLERIRSEFESERTPIVISGCIGPRGDGYVPGAIMTEGQAEEYHRAQIEVFADSAADLVTAITMNYVEEAIGIARAAKHAKLPVVISFTLEKDGKLPTGQPLLDAIKAVDDATSQYPAYFMINCAHPSHLDAASLGSNPVATRIRGLRANASKMSHAELNDATTLDAGNPIELGHDYAELRKRKLRHVNVMGGCCGTDARHVEQIAKACMPLFEVAT